MIEQYLEVTDTIDFLNSKIQKLARELARGCKSDEEIAKNIFEYVRDEIRHIGDHKLNIQACKASEVLKHKAGWCYAKSHLMAALLRANAIPAGFCYQRLSCSEYENDIYCLHGLNAIYLEDYGWYKVDARGNKEGVVAEFSPPDEKLAFKLAENEFDLEEVFVEPLDEIIEYLEIKFDSYEDMIQKLPDVRTLN